MRTAMAALFVAVLTTHADAGPPPQVINSTARVRSMDGLGRKLLAEGMAKSSTFRRLVHRLDRSDVIVYIELRPDLPPNVGGSLRFLARSATDRFLLVRLNRAHAQPTLIALLGHELQHAVEVADAPAVRSAEELRDYYRREGVPTGEDQFDSTAAREAGYLVRAELYENSGVDVRVARARAATEPALRESATAHGDEWREDAAPATEAAPILR